MAEVLREENLFTVLETGDKSIEKLHEKAIILIGPTRVGKSTLFNLLNGKLLIGKGRGLNTSYITQANDEGVAKMSSAFKSQTLEPNVKEDFTEDESLIDMAGTGDTRNFIGTIGVSYFLYQVFKKVKKAKFLLVIDQASLTDPTGAKMISTFQGFINMFRFDLMTPQIKQQLKNALSFVVTKATQTDFHSFLENVILQIKDPQYQLENRELIIELIESLMDSNRIQGFRAPKENETPRDEERKFMNRFNNVLKWEYFDLAEAAKQVKQESLIAIPLEKEFENLSNKDKQGCQKAIKDKLKSFKDLQNVLKSFLFTFMENWSKTVENFKNTGNFIPNFYNMKNSFEQIQRYLKFHDAYDSAKTVKINFKPNYEHPNLMTAINSIINGYEEIYNCNLEEVLDFLDKMNIISKVFKTLLEIFVPFCSNQEDQMLMTRLLYIVQRGIIECSNLYDLRKQLVHDIIYSLTDAINSAFGLPIKEFIEHFIKQMSSELMSKAFSSFQELQELQKLLQIYEVKCPESSNNQILAQLKFSISFAQAELCLRGGRNIEAFQSFDKVLRSFEERIYHLTESIGEEQIKEAKLKSLFMKKRKTILKMVHILKQLKRTETFSPLSYALEFCNEMKFTTEACEIYEMIIKSTNISLSDRSKMCLEYSNLLIQWGLLDKALEVLIMRQSIEIDDYDRYQESMKQIAEFVEQRDTYELSFRNRIKGWKEEPHSNLNLIKILEDINMNLPKEEPKEPVEIK